MKSSMVGFGVVAALAIGAPVAATVHVVEVANFSFTPENLTISVGDVVRWQWLSGSHTTTNGSSLSDPNLGKIWDAVVNSSSQQFQRTFNQVGVFPYLCRPHASFMTGTITVQGPSGILEGADEVPGTFFLGPNYPNPFNAATVISYGLARSGRATAAVHNLLGQRVAVLVDRDEPAGRHQLIWDGRDAAGKPVPSGIYFLRLEAGEFTQTRKMVLMR